MFKRILKNKKLQRLLLLTLLLSLNSCALFKPVKNEGEPQFKDYYFTDKDGNKIEESVKPSMEYIYLNIITENAIGEKVNLNLDDDETEIDYIYKGKYLNEGLSFKVRKDVEKVKLHIYDDSKKKHRHLKEKATSTAEKQAVKS
jgi:hypothetical protein